MKSKNEHGITLVTLVVTIIILIILAGISVNTLIGDKGIIKQTQQDKENILMGEEEVSSRLNQLYSELETEGNLIDDGSFSTKDEMIDLLLQQIEDLKKEVEALKTENEQLKKQIADLTKQIEQLKKEIEDLKAQIAAKDIEIAELKKQLAEKEAKIQELQNELNNLKSLLCQTNATEAQILTGYKAYSKGQLITGTMPNNPSSGNVQNDKAWTYNNGVYFGIPYGYYPPSNFGSMTNVSERYVTYGSLATAIGLTNAKLAVGQTVLGIAGTYTSDATATAGNILTGKTAYVNGSKITGTMANRGAVTSNLNCGQSYTIPAGYHSGSGKVTANSLASQTSATATAANISSGKTAWVNGVKITGNGADVNNAFKYLGTWTSTSFSISSVYSNYKNITKDDLIFEIVSIQTSVDNDSWAHYNGSKYVSYTPSSGTVSVGTDQGGTGSIHINSLTIKVYVKG